MDCLLCESFSRLRAKPLTLIGMKFFYTLDRGLRPIGIAQRSDRTRAFGSSARLPGPGHRGQADGHGGAARQERQMHRRHRLVSH